jgi:hypothetical protein
MGAIKAFSSWFKTNWKSNSLAVVAIVYSAHQFTTAVVAWEHHQPADWRAAIISLIVAAVGFVVKDASTHSTTAQVQLSSLQHPQVQAEAVVEAKAEAIAVPSGVPIVQPVPIQVPKAPEVIKPTEAKP